MDLLRQTHPVPRLATSALLTFVLVAGPASAVRADDVETMVQRGLDLRRRGEDTEALAEFQKALQLRSSPRVRAQAAFAEQALGLWAAAEEDLLQALSEARDSWIQKNHATLSKALEAIQSHLGNLQPWGTPAGASVFVDGKPVGTLPLKKPVRIAGETVLLNARAEGYLEMRRFVRVPAGEIVREHIELISVPPAASDARPAVPVPAAASLPGPPPQSPDAPAHPPVPSSSDAVQPPSPSALRPWAWATGVAGVGALTFGIVETFLRAKNKDAFNNYALPNPGGAPIAQYCDETTLPQECRPLKNAFDRSNTLMIVGYAAAGVLAAGSAVLFALSSPSTTDGAVALVCLPDGPGLSVGCRVAF